MKRLASLAACVALAACTQNPAPVSTTATPAASSPAATQPAASNSSSMSNTTTNMQSNPFNAKSTLPYQAPPFNRIKDTDYQPAIEEGMRQQLAEVAVIANNPEAPTFANTIVAMEKTGTLLTRAAKVFFALTAANTNDTLQKAESEIAPKLASHNDAIYMNPKLFARVKAIYDNRANLGLDRESQYLVERDYRNFIRAGAQLNDADQATLRALNQEESKLTTQFREKVLADTAASAIVIDDKAQLAGLSEGDIAAAAETAKERKLDGKWVLSLRNTTQQPALQSLQNRDVRTRLFNASVQRGNHGGENDTTSVITRLAELRAQKAKLLGYANYAAYSLDDQMAKTPENALKLLNDLVPASTAKATDEAAKMQKIIDAQKGGFTLGPQDWDFYAEQVRKAEYDLDESQVKPYFELNHVLNDGVFYAANQLYGLTFKERKDIPVYQEDVRVFEVFDADGTSLALFYADYYARPNKSGGAWMDSFVDQSMLFGTKPVVFNVANFSKPAAGQPALLSFDDVSTMFHEFGHALHGMFSNAKYPTTGGTNVPRDFVEFPSQFNEHWALEPRVFANYAKHYQTGAPMPQELVQKIRKSRTFNQGYATVEYLAAALLDMAWHTVPPGAPRQDVNTFEPAALQRFKIDMAQVPPRYHTTYFSHVWGGGYAAGYYAYLWSELIDDDAYYWFKENGGMTRANGQRFRDMVLSRGGTEEAATLYRAFRGRDPIVEPLLIERGLKADPNGEEK
ncbi:MAG TPA: peptidyl-dipeptidase Dcp [Thermoanaerobaculia bacterium]|nr:peptidyl-dipeptidase Dcp [Thermoanaerobaculia bacterium]